MYNVHCTHIEEQLAISFDHGHGVSMDMDNRLSDVHVDGADSCLPIRDDILNKN